MRGIENLVSMRSKGLKPSVVWVEMLPMQQWAKQLTQQTSRQVDIHIDPSDIPAIDRTDLRCLVGLQVYVNGPDDDTTEKVGQACFNAGASLVEAFRYDIRNPYRIEITRGTRYSPEGVKTVWPK
jgi:hypothetical protein